MALIFTCDCGKAKQMPKEDLYQPERAASKMMYCKGGECEKIVEDFLDKRDELHEKVQEQWQKGMKKLRLKDFDLPDQF